MLADRPLRPLRPGYGIERLSISERSPTLPLLAPTPADAHRLRLARAQLPATLEAEVAVAAVVVATVSLALVWMGGGRSDGHLPRVAEHPLAFALAERASCGC